MDFAFLVPITLFICILLAIKFVVDARVRRRIAETNPSDELMKAMVQAEADNQRLSALKWGLVMTIVGLAFGLVSALGLSADNPGTFGLLIGAAGVGMLAYHFVASRLKS